VPDYLLDTNILRYWYDTDCPEHANVLVHVSSARRPDPQSGYISRLFISIVTLGEIVYGHRVVLAPDPAKQAAFSTFVAQQCPQALELNAHVTEHYGDLKAWLFNNCSPKSKRSRARRLRQLVDPISAEELGAQDNDLWIAAQAITHNLVLVTHDSRGNFGRILRAFSPTLQVEDWTK